MPEKLADPILGDKGEIFTSGNQSWGAFQRDFPPTGANTTILVNVLDGRVPQSQAHLFCEIVERYPKLVLEILRSIFPGTSFRAAAKKFQEHFHLEGIDIRGHIPPSKCVLHYRTDLQFDWFVRVSRDYRVECCGEKD